jgi:alpha-beta hydrolase superfamily lysophospholipase
MNIETDHLRTADGIELYVQHLLPEGAPRAHLVIVHGYAEHSGRYAHVAEFFAGNGYAVHLFDLRGHGRSGGKKAYVDRFEHYLKDLTMVLDPLKREAKERPLFLLGHSMGGAVVAWYVLSRQPKHVDGVILSGALLKVGSSVSPFLQNISSVVGEWLPGLKTVRLDTSTLSRDPEVVRAYETDPLVYNGPTYARAGAEMIGLSKRLYAGLERFDLPALILHGSADRLTDPEGSRALAQRAASADKTLKVYEGLYHEILNEPEREEVMRDILEWMEARIGLG